MDHNKYPHGFNIILFRELVCVPILKVVAFSIKHTYIPFIEKIILAQAYKPMIDYSNNYTIKIITVMTKIIIKNIFSDMAGVSPCIKIYHLLLFIGYSKSASKYIMLFLKIGTHCKVVLLLYFQ